MNRPHSRHNSPAFGILLAATLMASPVWAQQASRSLGSTPEAESWFAPEDGAVRLVVGKRAPVENSPASREGFAMDSGDVNFEKFDLAAELRKRVHHDARGSDLWAMGANYKVNANEDGFAFMPFLGSDAPRTMSVHMRLDSVTVAGVSIELQPTATVQRNANRWTLNRGPVEVFYDLSPEAVEQSFALNVAGIDAEVVLDIEVTSDLPLVKSQYGALFAGELGGMSYTHAVVIDGAGHRLNLPIIASQGNLRLVVPADYMSQSVAPVIVDPLMTTFQVHGTSSFDLNLPDVAMDTTSNSFGFVHQSKFSTLDHDIWIAAHSGANGNQVGIKSVDMSDLNYTDPKVASDNASNQFLVTSNRRDVSGRYELEGRLVDATDVSRLSAWFVIGNFHTSTSFGWTNTGHDVAGKSQGSSLFQVVWTREFFGAAPRTNVRSRTIVPVTPFFVGSTPSLGAVQVLTNSNDVEDTEINISKSSGEGWVGEWRMVFFRESLITGLRTAWTAVIADDGTVTIPPTTWFHFPVGVQTRSLDVSAGLREVQGPMSSSPVYCVALHTVGSSGDDVWLYGLQDSNDFEGVHLIESEHQNVNQRVRYPAIATFSKRFTISYIEQDANTGNYSCYASSVDLTNTYKFAVSERRTLIANLGSFTESAPAGMASRYSGGHYGSRSIGVGVSVRPAGTWEQQGSLMNIDQGFVNAHQYCVGTANSSGDYAFIRMTGNNNLVDSKQLYASNMPNNQFGYFLVGHGGTGEVNPGGSAGVLCITGNRIGRYNQSSEIRHTGMDGSFQLDVDPTAIRSTLNNVAATSGATFNFQAWFRDPVGSSNFTNAVALTFD